MQKEQIPFDPRPSAAIQALREIQQPGLIARLARKREAAMNRLRAGFGTGRSKWIGDGAKVGWRLMRQTVRSAV